MRGAFGCEGFADGLFELCLICALATVVRCASAVLRLSECAGPCTLGRAVTQQYTIVTGPSQDLKKLEALSSRIRSDAQGMSVNAAAWSASADEALVVVFAEAIYKADADGRTTCTAADAAGDQPFYWRAVIDAANQDRRALGAWRSAPHREQIAHDALRRVPEAIPTSALKKGRVFLPKVLESGLLVSCESSPLLHTRTSH